MSPNTMAAAGGIGESSQPRSTPYDGGRYSIRYDRADRVFAFNVETSVAPPKSLLLDIEMASANGAYSVRAMQVDVTVEEDEPQKAFDSLADAVKEWLEYLQEEDPVLADDLEPQRRYTHLLRYAPHTWFGRLFIS